MVQGTGQDNSVYRTGWMTVQMTVQMTTQMTAQMTVAGTGQLSVLGKPGTDDM